MREDTVVSKIELLLDLHAATKPEKPVLALVPTRRSVIDRAIKFVPDLRLKSGLVSDIGLASAALGQCEKQDTKKVRGAILSAMTDISGEELREEIYSRSEQETFSAFRKRFVKSDERPVYVSSFCRTITKRVSAKIFQKKRLPMSNYDEAILNEALEKSRDSLEGLSTYTEEKLFAELSDGDEELILLLRTFVNCDYNQAKVARQLELHDSDAESVQDEVAKRIERRHGRIRQEFCTLRRTVRTSPRFDLFREQFPHFFQELDAG